VKLKVGHVFCQNFNPGTLTSGFCHVYTNVGCARPGFQK